MTRRFNVYMADERIANKIRILALYKNMTLGETFNFLYRYWEMSAGEDYSALSHWWTRTARDMRSDAPQRRD